MNISFADFKADNPDEKKEAARIRNLGFGYEAKNAIMHTEVIEKSENNNIIRRSDYIFLFKLSRY